MQASHGGRHGRENTAAVCSEVERERRLMGERRRGGPSDGGSDGREMMRLGLGF